MKIRNNMNEMRRDLRTSREGAHSNDASRFKQMFKAYDSAESFTDFGTHYDHGTIIDEYTSMAFRNPMMANLDWSGHGMDGLMSQQYDQYGFYGYPMSGLYDSLSAHGQVGLYDNDAIIKDLIQELSIFMEELKKSKGSNSGDLVKMLKETISDLKEIIKDTTKPNKTASKAKPTNLSETVKTLKIAIQELSSQVQKLEKAKGKNPASAQTISALKKNIQSLIDQLKNLQKPTNSQNSLKMLQDIIKTMADAIKNAANSPTASKVERSDLQKTVKNLMNTVKNLTAQVNTLRQANAKLKAGQNKKATSATSQANNVALKTTISKTIKALVSIIQDLANKGKSLEKTKGAEKTVKSLQKTVRDLTAQVQKLQKSANNNISAKNLQKTIKSLINVWKDMVKLNSTAKKAKHVNLDNTLKTFTNTIREFSVQVTQAQRAQKTKT